MMLSTADFECLPCGQDPWPAPAARINTTVSPQMAVKTNGTDGKPRPASLTTPPPKPIKSRSTSAREQRQLCPERQADGSTPNLKLLEDEAVGDGHGASARTVSAKTSSGNASTKETYLHLVSGPFFIEVFSGSGRMAQAVREHGLDAFEFDLTQQGGRRTSCVRTF